ncbi:MAG: glycoside hydrolase family 97 protein [Opitutaceae bacterium]|jgi:alpha-glucosidase|nr:glycoside hydrolase family 97 protein [Opitutaceae bacterium]
MIATSVLLASTLTLTGPAGGNRAVLSFGHDGAGAPAYRLETADGRRPLTRDAALGITVDGIPFGPGAEVVSQKTSRCVETFPARGNHGGAVSIAFNELAVTLREPESAREWRIEARMSDDTFAWRYIVPPAPAPMPAAGTTTAAGAATGAGIVQLVTAEASEFRPVEGCAVWLAERPNDWKLKSYAGYWMRAAWAALPSVSRAGPVQCPPLVVELPDAAGWLVFTEAGLRDYSGMRLLAADGGGGRGVTARADFTEGAKGFSIAGGVVSPWRVVRFARTLDALPDTTDVLEALSPAADAALFADTSWIKAGRATWFWWSRRRCGTPDEEAQMVRRAAELGFEYSLVDEGWLEWDDPWARVRELAKLGRERNTGVLLWRHMRDVMNPENGYADLRAYLDRLAAAGAAGMKIDFFNAESKDMVDLQTAIMREAAKRKLLVLFHGCQKPTGETRTWPNQLSREAIRGLELNGMKEGPVTAEHNCALPFTRLAIGPGDYTPLGFSLPGATTWAHQLATAAAFLSPLQVIAEFPEMLLADARCAPALDLLKALPVEWDETRVLAPSAIGECVVLARRRGGEWWVPVLNAEPRDIAALDLGFLGGGVFDAVVVGSNATKTPGAAGAAAMDEKAPLRREELKRVTRDSVITLKLQRGDGALLRFVPSAK